MIRGTWSLIYPVGADARWEYEDEFGRATLERHAPKSHVASLRLCVNPEHRRQGHGRRLIAKALEFAPSVGILRVEATPYVDNPEACGFFEALGSEWRLEGIRFNGGRRGDKLVNTCLYAWTV